MTAEEFVAKLLPREWLAPALLAGVGTGVVSAASAFFPRLLDFIAKVGPSPWRWWFVFGLLMLVGLATRAGLRKCEAKRRAKQRATSRRIALDATEKTAAERAAKEHNERAALYRSLRPLDRAVLREFAEAGVRSIPTDHIHARLRSKGVKGDEVGPALQRLQDRELLWVGQPAFLDAVANLLDPHFKRINDDPSLIAEPIATGAITHAGMA